MSKRIGFWIGGALAVGVLVGGVCHRGLGDAAAAPKAALDAAAQKRYGVALAEGRKLADQGKHTEAIAAFQRALTINPTAPKASSELGLAYYRLKQLAEAETATRKAIKLATEPAQRGRSLYNLGLILEAKGDPKAAVAAFKESLNERPHPVVLERLRKLDPAAAAALDPVQPRAMRGPFPSLSEACGALNTCKEQMKEDLSNAGPVYSCSTQKPLATLAKPAAPYLAVQLFETRCGHDAGSSAYEATVQLAVQVAKGWYVTAVDTVGTDEDGGYATEFKLKELKLTAPGEARVYLRSESGGGRDVGSGSASWESERLLLAGVGKSGTPSATPALTIRSKESEDPGEDPDSVDKPTSTSAKLKAELRGDELELSAASPARAIAKLNLAPIGKHQLTFP